MGQARSIDGTWRDASGPARSLLLSRRRQRIFVVVFFWGVLAFFFFFFLVVAVVVIIAALGSADDGRFCFVAGGCSFSRRTRFLSPKKTKNDACDATRGRPIELIRSARNETRRTTTTTTTRNEIKVTKRRRPQTSLCAKRRGTDNRRLGRRRLLFCFFLLLRLLFFPFDSPAPSTRNFHSKYENGGGCWRVSISLWRSPLSSVLVCVCVSVCVCVC